MQITRGDLDASCTDWDVLDAGWEVCGAGGCPECKMRMWGGGSGGCSGRYVRGDG